MMTLLKLDNIYYRYEGAQESVLKELDAKFDAGTFYAVVGKSGAGKSTFLSLLAGQEVFLDVVLPNALLLFELLGYILDDLGEEGA